MIRGAAAAAALLLASPVSAQIACPAGTVPATATIAPQTGQPSQHTGCVKKSDCNRYLPPFWRPQSGWVRSSYTCGR
jgi:hypothetical protein